MAVWVGMTGSVSKKTFALVVGDAPGASKLKKAVIGIVVQKAAFELLETPTARLECWVQAGRAKLQQAQVSRRWCVREE